LKFTVERSAKAALVLVETGRAEIQCNAKDENETQPDQREVNTRKENTFYKVRRTMGASKREAYTVPKKPGFIVLRPR
jgi:hypothetical protein